MHKLFIKAFVWNSSSAFMYKIILLSHQILLYTIIPHALYGLQSSIFAFIYTTIAITNFGFDETIIPCFAQFRQSKQQFWQLLKHFMIHSCIVLFIACLGYYYLTTSTAAFLHNIQSYCNKNMIFVIAAIFCIENIKKSAMFILQLAFLYQAIAYAQLMMLAAYLISVWSSYYWYGNINLQTILLPMLATSCIETGYLLYKVGSFCQKLPQETSTPTIPFKVLFLQRMHNYCNQIIKSVYSSNLITMMFAYKLGFEQAAAIKFFTNVITLCYTCIAKSIGITAASSYAQVGQSFLTLRNTCMLITYRHLQLLSILTLCIACITGYAYWASYMTYDMVWYIFLFLIIAFFEHIAIAYELLYIALRKSQVILWCNIISLTPLLAYWYGYGLHQVIVGVVITKISIIYLLRRICLSINRDEV